MGLYGRTSKGFLLGSYSPVCLLYPKKLLSFTISMTAMEGVALVCHRFLWSTGAAIKKERIDPGLVRVFHTRVDS